MEQGGGPADPADAAAAFEALRREVALLNVAVAGLAAERRPAPDYSETLGEIAKGVSVAVALRPYLGVRGDLEDSLCDLRHAGDWQETDLFSL